MTDMILLTGALPPSNDWDAAPTYQPRDNTPPPPFCMWVDKDTPLSTWGNVSLPGQAGFLDCLAAEEAFFRASTFNVNENRVLFSDQAVINWAGMYGYLVASNFDLVVRTMESDGIYQNAIIYPNAKNSAKKLMAPTDDALRSAISTNGPVKTGVVGEGLAASRRLAGQASGWLATGLGNTGADMDHCVSLCGYGTIGRIAQYLNVSVPENWRDQDGYAIFTWGGIGIIDAASLHNIAQTYSIRAPATPIRQAFVPITAGTKIASVQQENGSRWRLFVELADCHIQEYLYESGRWDVGQTLPPATGKPAGIGVIAWDDFSQIRVYYGSTILTENEGKLQEYDGKLTEKRFGDGHWNCNRAVLLGAIAPDTTSPIAVTQWNEGANIRIYYMDGTTIKQSSWNGSKWSSVNIPTDYTPRINTPLAVTQWSDGAYIRLYYQDKSGQLREICWEDGKWVSGTDSLPVVTKGTALSVISVVEGTQIRLYYQDDQDDIREHCWDSRSWIVGENLGKATSGTSISSNVWPVDGGFAIRLFYVNEGVLWQSSFAGGWSNGSVGINLGVG